MSTLTHFNSEGEAHMVDVGDKDVTRRRAIATGVITMQPTTLEMVAAGTHKKGDVLGIARVAAIMAAKKTPDLIPLCHSIQLTRVNVEFEIDTASSAVLCRATVECVERTGVEIEALAAVQIGLLTIYDMCKAVDRGMVIDAVRLDHKEGGRSGTWNRDDG